jgi:hypothetical protein
VQGSVPAPIGRTEIWVEKARQMQTSVQDVAGTLPARGIYEYSDGDPEWIGEGVFFTCEVSGGQKERSFQLRMAPHSGTRKTFRQSGWACSVWTWMLQTKRQLCEGFHKDINLS